MTPLLEQTPAALRDWFVERGLPGYRAGQVWKWLLQKRAAGFEQMTDLPAELRQQLGEQFQIWTTRVAEHRTAADGTEKLLLELHDGEQRRVRLAPRRQAALHRVHQHPSRLRHGLRLLRDRARRTASAISPAAKSWRKYCTFSGLLGAEERLSHVVVMGMGEPLLNLDALLPALAMASRRDGLSISVRRITISTVGLPAGIRRLAQENCQYHLAVSLHAADDGLRNELVPANRGFGIAAILAAADEYFEPDRPPRHFRVRVAGRRERPAGTRPAIGRSCFAAGRRW